MARRSLSDRFRRALAALGGRPAPVAGGTGPAYPPPMPAETRAEWDRMRARMLAALPYPRLVVPGGRALAEWERLRAEGRGWPVIVGDDEQLDAIAEQYSLDDQAVFPIPPGISPPRKAPAQPAAILAEAAAIAPPGSLDSWPGTGPDLPDPPLGAWPGPGMLDSVGLTVARDDRTNKPLPAVHILLIPTTRGWEVPAYLRWGNWNDCPTPAQHVAVLRHWCERFGGELIGINRDTLNLRVACRPTDRAAALALAQAQYRYCPDIIDQGVGSLSALAAGLMASDWWYFWWD